MALSTSGRFLVRTHPSKATTGSRIKPHSLLAPASRLLDQQWADNRASNNRWFSSSSGGFQLDALSFSISPEEALDKFQQWSSDQGLNFLINFDSIRIGAAYVPVWAFDVNMRFIVTDTAGRKQYNWKPALFSNIYPSSHNVVHLEGLGAYAGYAYRRSLVHPIVNTTLVFLGQNTCLLYTSPSPRDQRGSRMPSSA